MNNHVLCCAMLCSDSNPPCFNLVHIAEIMWGSLAMVMKLVKSPYTTNQQMYIFVETKRTLIPEMFLPSAILETSILSGRKAHDDNCQLRGTFSVNIN